MAIFLSHSLDCLGGTRDEHEPDPRNRRGHQAEPAHALGVDVRYATAHRTGPSHAPALPGLRTRPFHVGDIFQAAGRHQYQSRVDGDYRDNGYDRIARFGCKIKYPSLRGVFYFNYHRPNVRINPR